MISVQSHRLPSNGSKLIIILFIGCIVQSCGIFSSAGKKSGKVEDDLPGTVDREVEKVDTIAWTKVPESEVMPILIRNTGPRTEFKSSYNVVLIAPFDSRELQYDNDR